MTDQFQMRGAAENAVASVVKLPEDLTIRSIAQMASNLSQTAWVSPTVIDGRDVKTIDVAGLQVLLSARKSAEASGNTMGILVEKEGALPLAAARAGLSAQFEELLVASEA